MRLSYSLLCLFLAFASSAHSFSDFYVNEKNDLVTDCDFSYVVDNDNYSVTISELDAPHIKVKVLDGDWEPIYHCLDNCDDPIVVNNLPLGDYVINVMYFNADWETQCISNISFEITGGPCTDNDGDGLCDFEDCDDWNSSLPQPAGSPCDDNNGATINDIILDDECSCQGTLYEGPCNITYSLNSDSGILISGLFASTIKVRIFDSSDWSTVYSCDNDCGNETLVEGIAEGYYNLDVTLFDADFNQICHLNEYFIWSSTTCSDADNDGVCTQADCDDNNPSLPGTPGTACDDYNSATINDVISEDGCSCAGEVYEGLCSLSYLVGTDKITVSGLIADHVKVRIFDSNWQQVYSCFDDCDQVQEVIGLTPNAEYFLKVQLFDDSWEEICGMGEYFIVSGGNTCVDEDEDGYCDEIDCDPSDPAWPQAPGTSCDDGNDLTLNDVIQSDGCSCAGEEDQGSTPCSNIYINQLDDIIFIGNFPSGYISNVKVFVNWNLIFECTATCQDPTKIAELPAGDYVVRVKVMDNNWEEVCQIQETITMLLNNPDGLVQQTGVEYEMEFETALDSRFASSPETTKRNELELESKPGMGLYPNPVSDVLQVKVEHIVEQVVKLEIYNQLGQVVLREEYAKWADGSVKVSCQDLNPGVYYLVLRGADGVQVGEQFVKR